MSGQNKFVRIRTGMVALLLLLGTMLLTGCGVGVGGGTSTSAPQAATEAPEAYAAYPHFPDQKVTKANHTLLLSNAKKNQFDFVYTLSMGGKTLYKSQKIRPGAEEKWDILANCPQSGSLEITITAWSQGNGKQQNSVTQTIQVTLPKQAK